MVDIVTPENERMFRKQFSAVHGHSMECIEETVTTMGKVLASVCHSVDENIPLQKVLEGIDVEVFEKHLIKILDSKNCKCKK